MLEFQILGDGDSDGHKNQWRPLSERTTRDTQARIEHILHLDYDTFVNASFFLQGKADQFTQQKASDRKRILASILGLDAWEEYRNRAAERRKIVERELDSVDGRVGEINEELKEEEQRKQHLADLEARLEGLKTSRKTQETLLETVRLAAASFDERRKLVERLHAQIQRNETNLGTLQKQLAERDIERKAFSDLLSRAGEVETSYKEWQASRESLGKWEATAAEYHEYEKKRQPFLDEINSEKARLEQEQILLRGQLEAVNPQREEIIALKKEIESVSEQLALIENKNIQRDELKSRLDSTRERSAALIA